MSDQSTPDGLGADHEEHHWPGKEDEDHPLLDAAIEAEYETGRREESDEEAKANVLVRIGRMTLATIIIILGIIALPLPGPGWLIIAAGFTLLSKDVAWADRVVRTIRKRVPGVPEDGKIPRSSIVTMVFITIAGTAFGLWWTFGR